VAQLIDLAWDHRVGISAFEEEENRKSKNNKKQKKGAGTGLSTDIKDLAKFHDIFPTAMT
jgi:hypothetical protein